MMTPKIPVGSLWVCLENALLYKVLMVEDGEVIASTALRGTPSAADSFAWLSDIPGFLKAFKPMAPKKA